VEDQAEDTEEVTATADYEKRRAAEAALRGLTTTITTTI
jgi:hypothetical protein